MTLRSPLLCVSIHLGFLLTAPTAIAAETTWKAGTATVDITPVAPQRMAGYRFRNRGAEGTLHSFFLKVLAIEDSTGNRGVVVTSDLLGIPRIMYDLVCADLKQRFGIEQSQIMLHASHSHSSPALGGTLYDSYPVPANARPAMARYANELETKIVEAVSRAFADLAPARLATSEGITRFAVNRRTNVESSVGGLIANSTLKGPVDHSVPVLAVTTVNGALKAVLFGYACHAEFLRMGGDYAGFAQLALERNHPRMVAMFFSGCGADQNSLPRRELYLAQRYGEMLAAAVEEALLAGTVPLGPRLRTAHEFVDFEFGETPTQSELERLAASSGSKQPSGQAAWAARLLAERKAGRTLPRTYSYPVQAWQLGGRQLWIALGGEPVVDYSLRFKREFGTNTWVAGYANDLMAYIPSARVLAEDSDSDECSLWI